MIMRKILKTRRRRRKRRDHEDQQQAEGAGGGRRSRKEEERKRGLSRLQAVEWRRCTLMGLVMASSRWRCCWTRIQTAMWSQVTSGDPVTDS
jgi:hypothetical protein